MGEAQILDVYKSAWETTQRLLDAARAEAWDELVSMSHGRDSQLALVMDLPATAVSNPMLANELRQLIRNILAADQQIQQLTQAWMNEIQGVLSSVKVEQKLLKAYDPL